MRLRQCGSLQVAAEKASAAAKAGATAAKAAKAAKESGLYQGRNGRGAGGGSEMGERRLSRNSNPVEDT